MKPNVKKLIIVCDDKTKVYANYLRQLISLCDDTEDGVVGVEDGSVEASVWTDKEYDHNSQTISSNMHILFIGKNKVSKTEITTMDVKYEKFGMRYGWLGKRGMLDVDSRDISDQEYEDFLKYCTDYTEVIDSSEVSKAKQSSLLSGINAAVLGAASAVMGIGGIPASALITSQGINKLAINKKIHDQQFKALTAVFYYEGISKYLEE